MATLYASGTTWNTASDWGLSTGASDGSIPTATDDCIFDANSVSMAIDVDATCQSIDSTGFTATLTQNAGFTLTVGSGGVLWAAGTFVGGDSNIIISGGVSQSGGAFTSTSANLQFDGGNFTRSAGTFTHNSGTVRFDGNNQGINVAGSDLFNLTLSNQNPSSGFTFVSAVTIKGKYFHEGGTIASTSVTVSLEGDAESRNIQSNTSVVLFEFIGTANQAVTANGGSGSLTRVGFNKSAGTVTFNDEIHLRCGSGVNIWTRTAGTIVFASGAKILDRGFSTTWDDSQTLFNDVEIKKANNTTSMTVTGTLKIGGDFTITGCGAMNGGTIELAGNLSTTDASVGGTAAITFNGTGTQTIDMATGDLPNGTFTVNKASGSLSQLSAVDLNGTGQDMVITAGTFYTNGFDFAVNDLFTIAIGGKVQLDGDESSVSAPTSNLGIVEYIGSGVYVLKNWTYEDLWINGTGTFSWGSALIVNGDLDQDQGLLQAGNVAFTVTGTFTMASGTELEMDGAQAISVGTFTASTGSTVEFTNTGNEAVMTNLGQTFYIVIWAGGKIHKIASGVGNGIVVNGQLSTTGDVGNRAIIRSTTDGVQAELKLVGTSILGPSVDVKDSDASAGLVVNAVGSLNSLNNDNWNFGEEDGVVVGGVGIEGNLGGVGING